MTLVSIVRIFVGNRLVIERVDGPTNITHFTQPRSQFYGIGFSGCGIIWIGLFSAKRFLLAENASAAAKADDAGGEKKQEKKENRDGHKVRKRIQTKRVTDEI